MESKLEKRRIWIFLGFAFGLAWALDVLIYLTGGVSDLHKWSLPMVLLLCSMAAPTVAHLMTRLVTGEGWKDLYLLPRLRSSWRTWLAAWWGTPLLILLGAGLYFAVFPHHVDPALPAAQRLLDQTAASTGQPMPFGPAVLVLLQVVQGFTLVPLTNGWATFGEEFGWRAYLLGKLMPFGGRRAVLLLGGIWGVWHWPLIAMGYNYGLDYVGAPWLGLLGMAWFTVVTGTWLAWMTRKGRSVWPAVIGHAALNGLGTVGTLLLAGHTNPLLGPTPLGVIGSLPFALLALWLLWRSPELGQR